MIRLKAGTDLAALLCTLMSLSRVSPVELASRSGYAEGQISRWRRGVVVPSATVLLNLADALDYDLTLTPRNGA